MSTIERFCITEKSEFLSLVDEWNLLADRTDPRSVFLRHEWFDAAWCWQENSHEMAIVCIRREGKLIGICPLVLRHSIWDRIAVTVLEFLAVPDTQECAILADPADLKDVIAGMIECLSSGEISCDVMRLDKVRTDSPANTALTDTARRAGLKFRVLDGGSNPNIGLKDDWQSYYSRRSRRLKKGNNLVVNRLRRDDRQVEISCFDQGAVDDFDLTSLLETLTSLSESSWKASTGLTLNNRGPKAFITRLSQHAIRNSWFLVWVLTIDGEPAAMEYQLEFNGVVSGLRADYDQRFESYSPGTLLNWRIIEELFEREASVYSLGPGSNQYKMRWAEEEHQLNSIVVYGTTIRGWIVKVVDTNLRPLAKRMIKVLKYKETSD